MTTADLQKLALSELVYSENLPEGTKGPALESCLLLPRFYT